MVGVGHDLYGVIEVQKEYRMGGHTQGRAGKGGTTDGGGR